MNPTAGRHPRILASSSLRWATGLFCAFIGSFMLVAPHQFGSRAFGSLPAVRSTWAVAALAAGVTLLSVAALRTTRRQRLLAHGLASAVMLSLGGGVIYFASGLNAIPYLTLGSGLLSRSALRGRQPEGESGDLLALLTGIMATLLGGGLLLVPRFLRTPFSEGIPPAPHLVWLAGIWMLLSGPLLVLVQLRPATRRLHAMAHLAGGLSVAAYGLLRTLTQPAWTVIFLYCGMGVAVAALPWGRRWSAGFDASALRTRMALALATATSLALVLAVAISSAQEESLATAQAQETLQVEARSVAQDVRDYLELDGARAASLAALASQLPLTGPAADAAGELLAKSLPLYPHLSGLLLLGLDGGLITGKGAVAIAAADRAAIVAGASHSQASPLRLATDRAGGRTLLVVGAPVIGRGGQPLAVLAMAFGLDALQGHTVRSGSIVSLGDGYGTLIARDENLPGATSRLPAGWDQEARAGAQPEIADRLVALAPVDDLGWQVAIERPRSAALAGVNRGRDLAFALLLLVLPLAIVGGILVARLITRPLASLADAVEELAAGNSSAPLENSTIGEVERLSAAFRESRDRLAVRTAERERLAAEVSARAEALAETDRRKDEFLAMLAHELRNPLGAITNAAYLVSRTATLPPPASRSVAVIQRQAQHLGRLVDDLLDVSRITQGKVELQRGLLDLNEVIRHTLETTRSLLEARRHRLEVALPATPLMLIADPTRLEQVLANLVRNAVKFSDPNSLIVVEATAHGGWAVVRVRDTGVGIAQDLLPRVFDLFTQGHQGLDRSTGGLGIGLTLVRNLVEMHGGRVSAESEGEGRGSEFIVWLPLASAADLRAGGPAPQAQAREAAL